MKLRRQCSTKEKRVYIRPPIGKSNQYINLISKAIIGAGYSVNKSDNYIKAITEVDFIIVNWYENLRTDNAFLHLLHFIIKFIRLVTMMLFGKKIIWVVHNKQSHSNKSKYSILLMKILLKVSDIIIIHCDATMEVLKKLNLNFTSYRSKIIKIPHPNYIGVYKSNPFIVDRKSENLKLLFVGVVKKYKNIDLLIQVINSLKSHNIHLTIAGNSIEDDEFKQNLLELAANSKNIHFDLRFIEDEEIAGLIESHDILVLPYDIQSSLNSGTIIMAFSYKKTVISPLIGTLQEYEDKSFFYSYEYQTPEEHYERLKEVILQVIEDHKLNPLTIKEKGEVAYSYVKKNNSLEIVSDIYREMLNSL